MKKDLAYYKELKYPIRINPDPEGGFVASIPDLPGCYAFGETIEQAVEDLNDSKELWLETYYETHGEAPEPGMPRDYSGKFLLRLPKYLHRKLDEAARAEATSLNQYVVSLLAEQVNLADLQRRFDQLERQLEEMSVFSVREIAGVWTPEKIPMLGTFFNASPTVRVVRLRRDLPKVAATAANVTRLNLPRTKEFREEAGA